MHTAHERRSWVDDVLRGIDSAVSDLDQAIDALAEAATPGRAHRLRDAATRCATR